MCRSLLKVTTTAAMSTGTVGHLQERRQIALASFDPSQGARHAEDEEQRAHRHREGEGIEHEQAGEAGADRRAERQREVARPLVAQRLRSRTGHDDGGNAKGDEGQRADDSDGDEEQEVLIVEDAVLGEERAEPAAEQGLPCDELEGEGEAVGPGGDAGILASAGEEADDRVEEVRRDDHHCEHAQRGDRQDEKSSDAWPSDHANDERDQRAEIRRPRGGQRDDGYER